MIYRLLYEFHPSFFNFNMKISIHKTKAIFISKDPIRWKLEIDGRMVKKVMKFNYLSVKIASSGNLVKENKTQAQKAARVAG